LRHARQSGMVRKKGPDFVKLSRIRPDVRGDTTLSTLASRLGRVGSEGSPRILAWATFVVAGVLLVGDRLGAAWWAVVLGLTLFAYARDGGGRGGSNPSEARRSTEGSLPAMWQAHLDAFLDFARRGDRASFMDLAAALGIPGWEHEAMWNGTVARLGRAAGCPSPQPHPPRPTTADGLPRGQRGARRV